MCGWLNDITDDDLDWELKQGPTSSVHTGPPVDHTTGTAQGEALYPEQGVSSHVDFCLKTGWVWLKIIYKDQDIQRPKCTKTKHIRNFSANQPPPQAVISTWKLPTLDRVN